MLNNMCAAGNGDSPTEMHLSSTPPLHDPVTTKTSTSIEKVNEESTPYKDL